MTASYGYYFRQANYYLSLRILVSQAPEMVATPRVAQRPSRSHLGFVAAPGLRVGLGQQLA
jgi:hypothetical protein